MMAGVAFNNHTQLFGTSKTTMSVFGALMPCFIQVELMMAAVASAAPSPSALLCKSDMCLLTTVAFAAAVAASAAAVGCTG
jgi:hypothetical protein